MRFENMFIYQKKKKNSKQTNKKEHVHASVVNVNIITLVYFVTKQHLDRSSELLAPGEPQLRRVEVRDRGT